MTPQAFDPKLCSHLPPAAVMSALLSLGTQLCTKALASSSLSPHSQQSEDNQVQLVPGSAAATLAGLHPQATLRNSFLGLTCYTFTTSDGPGNVSPAAACCWEGTCQEPQLSCRRGVELHIFYMVHLEQDGARSIKIKKLHLSTFRTRYQVAWNILSGHSPRLCSMLEQKKPLNGKPRSGWLFQILQRQLLVRGPEESDLTLFKATLESCNRFPHSRT